MPSLLNLDSIFAAAIEAEHRAQAERLERARMEGCIAFCTVERARRYRDPYDYRLAFAPALIDCHLIRKGAIVDHDAGDGEVPPHYARTAEGWEVRGVDFGRAP